MKNKRVARGKIGVAKGFGPRHAENGKEGEPIDLTKVNTDTVPAMLSPREAVLTRNAAELAGRDNIEKLNEEGNQLAQKGVDLAARGKTSVAPVALPKVPRVVASGNVLKYVPEGQIRREVAAAIPKGVQKGENDMKPKKMQGGGNVPPYGQSGGGKLNGYNAQGLPNTPAGGWNAGNSGYTPPDNRLAGGGDPMPVQGPMFPGSPAWQRTHPNYQAPAQTPFAGPDFVGSPQWRRTHPNYYGGTPGAGGGGPGLQGGGFYPPGQGFASGTPEVPETIGSPNTQQAYGPPIQLSAPALQRAAVQAGLNPGQIQGLMKAVQGVGQGYGAMFGDSVGGATGTGALEASGGFQGGISDIGYPPFLMPNAQYHADKGSTWEGPYDPQYLVQRYMRGTGMVPGW